MKIYSYLFRYNDCTVNLIPQPCVIIKAVKFQYKSIPSQ